MNDDLEQVLAAAAQQLPDDPQRLVRVRARSSVLRRRRHRLAAAGVVAVGVAGAVIVVAGLGGAARPDRLVQGADPTPAPSGPPLFGASGRVVSVPGRPVRFCANAPMALALVIPTPPPAYCDFGVDVVGVDLEALAGRREAQGAVEGMASLTGTLKDSVLTVVTQGPPAVDTLASRLPDNPPCPAPTGGWPRGANDANLDVTSLQAYASSHPDTVVELALLRPASDQVVAYLLVTGDPGPAVDALRPTYGQQLCVFPSRYTKAQAQAAQADPAFNGGAARQVYTTGQGLAPDGQLQVTVGATLETPELRAAVARHPAGLVRLDLFLNRVGGAP
jgi:hypothetical protein